MIRIDEIYSGTCWPYIKKYKSGVRMFYCDPFGRSDPDSIFNYTNPDRLDTNYTLFFDQEPIHLDVHLPTFDRVKRRSDDIGYFSLEIARAMRNKSIGTLVTSEKDSDNVDFICAKYNWRSRYYFFHGWAALDWYRGYDKTFIMPEPKDRTIRKTFISPNRIIAGLRQHRLLMLYHIFKNNMTNNWISCPSYCPAENISILEAIRPLEKIYPDIESVFNQQPLPLCFPGENDHPMHSCWLSLFDESAESLLYLVSETVASGRRLHLTEKTFKPICLKMPFIIVGTRGSLAYLRSYGFKTFSDVWDESYDDEPDDILRLERIASLLRSLDELSPEGKQDLYDMSQEVIEHNYNHFYNGGFEKILWAELSEMLESLDV